jgi:glyoxylase-like metal-dependent hydrolase (beta-lactamase superfamily II)
MPDNGCEIELATLGPFETNTYLVYPKGAARGAACWIVDPSFGPEPVIERVKELGLTPAAIVLTHAHADHIAGVDEVLNAFPAPPLPVLVHQAERDWLKDPVKNLSLLGGMPVTAKGPTSLLAEGHDLDIGGVVWKVIHTPGHSPGGVSLYHAPSKTAIVGDTLFAGSVGRFDFPGSDGPTLERSIREKLYALPDDVTIYPGHGPSSTIGQEKRTNPFVRA